MTERSLVTNVVLDAALSAYDDEHLYVVTTEKHAGMIAAAAIKAAADQVVPMALCVYNDDFVYVRRQLQTIAAELEAQ